MRNFKRIISAVLSTALVFTGSLSGFIPADRARAETFETAGEEYAEGRVIVCVQETEGSDGGAGDEAKSPALFSLLPFGDSGSAESLLAGAEELMDVSDAMEEVLSEEPDILSEDEVRSARQFASDTDGALRTTLKVIDSDKYSTEELIDKLSGLPQVVFAEPDYIVHTDTSRADDVEKAIQDAAYQGTEVSHDTPDLTGCQYANGNGPGGIDVPDWNDPSKKNAEGVVVAVIDSGVNYNHPDLDEVMWDKGLEYESLTEMGGGKYGYCAAEENSSGIPYDSDDPMDDQGHGTFCSGIVAAEWDGRGISGATNGAKILTVKALNDLGGSAIAWIIRGMSYVVAAKKAGINIAAANCSIGLPLISRGWKLATQEMVNSGVVVVYASGNSNVDIDYTVDTSSNMTDIRGRVVVNSCNDLNLRSSFSNYGARVTDLFAPGSSIYSTDCKDLPLAVLMTPSKDKDGSLMIDDFDGQAYFDIKDISDRFDISLSVEEDPETASDHALKAEFTIRDDDLSKFGNLISFTPGNPNAGIDNTAGELKFVMDTRASTDGSWMVAYVKTVSQEFKRSKEAVSFPRKNHTVSFTLPEDADLNDPEIRLAIYPVAGQEAARDITVWIDDCFISADAGNAPYAMADGTSFSTPAVTGEAAILAAAFPSDSVEKRAARILGSAVPYDQFKGLCVTGGLANVRNALDQDYMPVVNGIQPMADGLLAISGYFFGARSGTEVRLTQYGTEYVCDITGLQEDPADADYSTVYVKVPEGLKSGEVLVSVSDTSRPSSRQTGSRYLNAALPDKAERFYERLPYRDHIDHEVLHPMNIAGVCDTLYISGIDHDIESPRSFSIKGDVYSWLDDGLIQQTYTGNLCAYDKKIWYMDPYVDNLAVYDPALDKKESYDLSEYSDFRQGTYSDILNTGDGLLIFNTNEDKPTEVWKLDPFTLKVQKLFDLKAIYSGRNIYGINVTKQGREIYIGIGRPAGGGERSVMEKILINDATGEITHEYVSKDILPEGFTLSSESPVGCGTKEGIYLTGGYKLKEGTDQIGTDNWYFDYAHPENGFMPCEKRISPDRIFSAAAGCYKGEVYFAGFSPDTEKGFFIAVADAPTWDMGDEAAVPDPQPEKEVTSLVIVGEKSLALKTGESAVLSCKASFPGSMPEDDRPPLLYKSENEKLVRINPLTGELLALNPGSTRVTASCGNKSVSFDITVAMEATPSELPKKLILNAGEQYNTAFYPGYSTGKEKVTWTSLDKKTAVVKNGLITAKKAGTTLIRVTVKDGKKVISSQECYLTVKDVSIPKAQSKDKNVKLSLDKSSIKAKVGETIDLKASLKGNDRDKALIVSDVTNENLISKAPENDTQTGQASGKKLDYGYSFKALAPGTAYITVTSTNPATGAQNTKLCKVTVTAPAEKMDIKYGGSGTIEGDTYTLKKGAIGLLRVEISPENCTDTAITWKAKGGAVTVRNGVINTKKVSKKDKNTGKYIPDTVTVKCGKITKIINVNVEE